MGIPASVLAQYQSVNNRATQTASTPFQDYSGAFVAPVNAQQNAGIANTNAAAGEAQPYYGAATNTLQNAQAGTTGANNAALGLTAASAAPVNAQQIGSQQISQFMNPYVNDVAQSTANLLGQNNAQAQASALGTAISSGAFGGDRTGLAAANLQQQQNLSNANTYAGILSSGYNTALSAAQQQQGVNLSAGQANRAALGAAGNQLASIGQTQYGEGANTANTLASLGSGAQSAGLQGASAQINAGTLQQQTQQAQDTAQYNQFQQQQSYPFQVDQFLANIAEGTGALSGSTTTTQQPGGFFSDERLKTDKKPIGKTYDGQTIYSYKMKGDPRTRIGLMAQDVEKKHPDAVGLAAGYKTVDYGLATDEAANKRHFYAGGVVPIRRARDAGGGVDPYDIGSALSAQQNMYGHMGVAGGNRNIPSQGSSHQLAVANGAPAPQPSGASKVNTTIGLGKDAYSGYKWATKPSAGSATPDASGVGVAGDNPQYLDAAASSLDGSSAGVGAADAGAADAAGSGVAAAAPAAADAGASAAAGAATSAAAGAAVDAGAEEAAALAAEYAVGDVAVAALAAKRGGAIRSGLAAGGIPYEDPSAGAPYSDTGGGMNIPDTENTAKVQTAGPIKKQPTGLQTLMMMGNPDDASTIAGGMFSNTALAAGGRIHKDEGGGLDPDPDFTTDPTGQSDYVQKPIEVKSSSKFSGVAPDDVKYTGGVGGLSLPSAQMPDTPAMPAVADESSSGVAPRYEASREETPPTDSGGSWFHKHAGDILPVLQGIAAMGTAPTRSWGTALAAGLGAGAGAYVPDQEGLARAALTNQEATGRSIQNQSNQMGLDMFRSAMKDTQSAPLAPQRPAGMVAGDANDPQEFAFQKFAAVPTARPASVTQMQTAMAFGNKPEVAKSFGDAYDQKVAGENQNRVLAANAAYQGAVETANAPPGKAMQALQQLNPQKAAQIQQSGLPPDQMDAQARTYAQQLGLASHQYSGRETDMQNGVMIDKKMGAPVLGSEQVMTGLTAEGKQAAYEEAMQPIILGNGLPGYRYQQSAGIHSPEQYVQAADRAARLRGNAPPAATGQPAPAVGGTPGARSQGAASVPTGVTRAAAPAAVAGEPAAALPRLLSPAAAFIPIPGVRTATGAQAVIPRAAPPELQKALADPKFNLPPLPAVTDQTTKGMAADQAADNFKNAQALKTYAGEVSDASGRALQNFQAAKAIIDAPSTGPIAGFPGGVAQALANYGFTSDTADNRAEVVKYLTNGALSNLKDTYGSKPAMFDVKVNLEQAFPDIKTQGIGAVKDLVNTSIRSLSFDKQTASRVDPYIAAGKNPADFKTWNNENFDRATAVNKPAARPGQSTSGQNAVIRTGTLNGRKVAQYADGTTKYVD